LTWAGYSLQPYANLPLVTRKKNVLVRYPYWEWDNIVQSKLMGSLTKDRNRLLRRQSN